MRLHHAAPGCLCLLLATTVAPAQGVRLAARRHASAARDIGGVGQDDASETSCKESLPMGGLKSFIRRSGFLMDKEDTRVPSDTGARPKVVLGIFVRPTCRDDDLFLQKIQSTWMSQPLVCPISQLGNSTQCSFFFTFVMGTLNGGKTTTSKKVTVLDFDEMSSCGKSQAWFQHAAATYTQATHIAKMDLDTFPHVSRIVSAMQHFESSCGNVFGGRPWTAYEDKEPSDEAACAEPEFCPPTYCGAPIGGDFLRYKSNSSRCFSYMQGAFYFMSRQLAVEVAKPNGWWQRAGAECWPEDIVAGHAVQKHGREQGTCVAALQLHNPEEYFHIDHWNPRMGQE